MPGDRQKSAAPQSVTRVIRILDVLCASSDPVSLAELSRALGAPKSSLAALLAGLADEGFVTCADGLWRLGPGAYGLGAALNQARRQLDVPELVRTALHRLADACGETALYAVADAEGQTITYVDVAESRNAVRFALSIGDRRPLYATSAGRALLSALPSAQLEAYLTALKPTRLTEQTLIERAALAEAIDTAREAGVAQTVDQAAEGVTGTAAVIRDAAGSVLGALVVAAPTSRWQDRRAVLAELVRSEAEALSRSLGYRPRGG